MCYRPGRKQVANIGEDPTMLPQTYAKLHAFNTFADLRGASIGIGPEGSGTAYLMRQLFDDADLHRCHCIAARC